MTLERIKDWLKPLLPPDTEAAVGHIGDREKFVGVYNARAPGRQRICLGGVQATKYQEKRIRILIHWTKDAAATEESARALWEQLYGKTQIDMGGTRVHFIDPGADPISVGRDARGVAEYIIEATFYHERDET